MAVTITNNQFYPTGARHFLQGIVLNEPSASFQFELISSSYTPTTAHQYFRSGSDTNLPYNHTCSYASKNTPISASTTILSQTASVPGGAYLLDRVVATSVSCSFNSVTAGQTVAGVVLYVQNGADAQPCTCSSDIVSGGSKCYNWAIWLNDKDGNPINITTDGGDIEFSFNIDGIANPGAEIINGYNPNYYGAVVGLVGCSGSS